MLVCAKVISVLLLPVSSNMKLYDHKSVVQYLFVHIFSDESSLRCMQCAQGALKDERSDCDKQTAVSCISVSGKNAAKNYCLTRQVLIEDGKYSISILYLLIITIN